MKPVIYIDHIKNIDGEIRIGSIIRHKDYDMIGIVNTVGTHSSGVKTYGVIVLNSKLFGSSDNWANDYSQLISCTVKIKQ